MTDVLVVGGIAREIDVTPDGARRPRLAGSGLVAALVASRLGARVSLAGFVGGDDNDALRDLAAASSVDATGVAVVAGASPHYIFGDSVGGAGVPHFAFRPSEALPGDRPAMPPTAAVAVIFGMPGFDAVASGWLDGVDLGNGTVVWDRQGWLSAARDGRVVAALPCARRVRLTKVHERRDEADDQDGLRGVGFEAAIVKRGLWGADLVTESNTTPVPAFDVPVRRVIGSGDAFAGALGALLADGSELEPAAVRASAAAACVIADGGIVPPADLAERSAVLVATATRRWVSGERLAGMMAEVHASPERLGAQLAAEAVEGRLAALGVARERLPADCDEVAVRLRDDESVLGTWRASPTDPPDDGWLERLAAAVTEWITASDR